MMFTDKELLEEMNSQNPWWATGKVDLEENLIYRDMYPTIRDELEDRIITAVIGLRRTGKTTLMKQCIKMLLDDNPPGHIFYFSFDAMEKQNMMLRKVFKLYTQNILKEVPNELESKIFIFFDEVQKVEKWGEEIKSIWDRKYPIKFIVSGSSSMNILKGGGESLVGRLRLHRLYTFSFCEFLRLDGIEPENITIDDMIEDDIKYPTRSEKVEIKFDEYLKESGFPEIYDKKDKKGYLSDIISLTFYRDIVNMLPVKRTEVLEGLFHNFISQSGQVINYNQLADSLNTKYKTIKDYIDHLETSFLIERSKLFSRSKLKGFRKNPKIYVSDHGFSMIEKMEIGLKIETLIHNHLTRSYDVYYWKEKRELDVVIERDGEPLPIEIKYKEMINDQDLRGLTDFMDKQDIDKGIIVTKKDYRVEKKNGKEYIYIPAWLFLLSDP